MVHAVYFSEGKALSYQNHWLRTPRLLCERAYGGPLWPRVRAIPVKSSAAAMLIVFRAPDICAAKLTPRTPAGAVEL
jgi:carotenoid cleavage dioxygenase-like enzyme